MPSHENNEQAALLWKPPVDEKAIHKMKLPQLETDCNEPFPSDADEAHLAIIKYRIFASKLRNKHKYSLAKQWYHEAVSKIRDMLTKLSETQQTEKLRFYRISLLETGIDFSLALFEQGCYSECLDKLRVIEPDIENFNEDFKDSAEGKTLLLKCFLLSAEAYDESNDMTNTEEYLNQSKLLIITSPEDKARFFTVKANLAKREKKFEEAKTNYAKAFQSFEKVAQSNVSRGAWLRYAKSSFNLARSYGEIKEYKKAITCLKKAHKQLKKVPDIGPEDALTCRFHLEMARFYECDHCFQDAITQGEIVNSIHKKYLSKLLEAELHQFDLYEHISLVKRLAYWYVKTGQLLKAGDSFVDAAVILNERYPYQSILCLKWALSYFQVLESAEKTERLATALTSLAKTYRSLPCPDLINALATIKNAILLQGSLERTQLQENIQLAYEAQFRGWRKEWIIQWSWCLHNLSDFQQNWASLSSHRDDFFHWQAEKEVLPPQRRVQLVMLLSRLYCLLDQSYNYFIRQTVYAGEKNPPLNLYFPFELSAYCLKNTWEMHQKVWDRSVEINEVSQQLGFKHPSFKPACDAITEVQPFIGTTGDLFKLYAIINYSKHVHIGVQRLAPHDVQTRYGLIKKRFNGVEIGFTRMGSQVCPFSFEDILNNIDASNTAYHALLDAGILNREDPSDNGVASVEINADIEAYLKAITDVESGEKALEACENYSALILSSLKSSSIDKECAQKIARFLLNLVAQARGLEDTEDRIDAIPFIERSCDGISRLLGVLGINEETITGKPPEAVTAVEEVARIDAIPDSNFEFLNTQYQETLCALRKLDPESKGLKTIRKYHDAASGLFLHFLVRHSLEDIERLLEEVSLVLPASLLKSYVNQLNEWQINEAKISALVRSEISVFDTGIDIDSMDGDLLARIKHIHQTVYYDLPLYLFSQDSHSKMLRINTSVDVYLQIHFILDQIYKRYVSKALGSVSNEPYPVKEDELKRVDKMLSSAGHSLPKKLYDQIKNSFHWWGQFRALSLRAKHSRIEQIMRLADPGFSNKGCSHADINPGHTDYVKKQKPPNGVKLLQILKVALCDTKTIFLMFSQAIAALPATVVVYNHLKTIEQAREASPRSFSAAGVAQSALRSAQRSSLFASSGFDRESQSEIDTDNTAGSAGGGGRKIDR